MIHGGIFPQNEAAFVRFPNKMNFVFSKFMVVSLAEFGAVKLQTLQEMKIISMFAPKRSRLLFVAYLNRFFIRLTVSCC